MLLLLLACTGTSKDASSETGETAADSGTHPNVPPGYEYKWDTDGCGDDNDDTQTYILGVGETDADGNFTATETRYRFYGRDWEDDDIDILEFTGTAVSQADLANIGAGAAEEGYLNERFAAQNESGSNYSEENWFIFDTLTPSGNLNLDNAMLVFQYIEGYSGNMSLSSDYARGVFTPSGEELGPPATYTWEGDSCSGW